MQIRLISRPTIPTMKQAIQQIVNTINAIKVNVKSSYQIPP